MSDYLIPLLTNLASGIAGGVIVALANHHLAQRRDLQKEARAKAEAEAASRRELEAAQQLSATQRELLRYCASPENPLPGVAQLLGSAGLGTWVRVGSRDFREPADLPAQARYLDAFSALVERGYFRTVGGRSYQLTSKGYEAGKPDR
jgi:hypothetical protein